MINKNSYFTGFLIGILIIGASFGLLFLLKTYVLTDFEKLTMQSMFLVSIIPALLVMRYLFVKKQFVKTASILLVVIVIVGLLSFILKFPF